MATPTEGPIPLGANGDMTWFARGRVVVTVPQNMEGGRPEAMARLTERSEVLGNPLALAILVREGLERPSSETREDIRRSFDEISPMLACNTIVILGSGFFSSFFISIVSRTLRLTRRGGANYQIHTSLESAAAWMHAQLGDPETSIEDVLAALQQALAQSPPLTR